MELLRLCVVAILSIFIVAFVVISLLQNLHTIQRSTKRPHELCAMFYTQLRILFGIVQTLLQIGASLAVFFGHIGTLLCFWFVINCLSFFPFLVSVFAVLLACYLVFFTLLLLPAASYIGETTWELVHQKRSLYYIPYGKRCLFWRRNLRYQMYMQWRAQMGINLECGSFFIFHGSTTIAYLTHTVNNLATAVILIHP